jgi:hypothetical protein
MPATITQFRKHLFQMADQALHGEPAEFLYRGVVFKVIPEKKQSKLDKLVGQQTLAPGVDLEQASRELLAEMEAEWLHDWSEESLGG